jgi:molecular chaperone GrpE
MSDMAEPMPVASPASEEEAIPIAVAAVSPPPDSPGDLGTVEEPDSFQRVVAEGLARILEAFDSKLAYDRFKEDQITRLHEELQGYKSDLLDRLARQLLQGLIRLHDDLGKKALVWQQKPIAELTPEKFRQQFDDLQDDLELLLGQHGVERFEVQTETFDPHRQTAVRTVPTEDASLAGRVAQRLRPGFQQANRLLQKERVVVYTLANRPSMPPQGA